MTPECLEDRPGSVDDLGVTFRRPHWGRFLLFLILVSVPFGALIGRREGLAVGIFMAVLLAVMIGAASGVVILWAQGKGGR
jgi:lipopolysaccharide export LptBFGC system permease protein LptF